MATARTASQFPTQTFVLPFEFSHGEEAVALYEQSGRKAFDWQKLQIENILAVNDDGLWTHQKYGYEVPRQNGKGEILAMREFYGLTIGENIAHTAHKTSTSHSAFIRLVNILSDAGYVELGRKKKDEEIPEKSYKATKQYGLEQIFLTGGGMIVFRTRTESGGIGESFDLLVIDEAQEYTEGQKGALAYTIAASPNPQTIYCGTPPTVSSKGSIFPAFRRDTLAGNEYEAGWAEWSIYSEPEDFVNPALWYQTNPSLGLRLRERTIRAELPTNKASRLDFLIQRLGYWYSYELKSEITEADWMGLKVKQLPAFQKHLYAGIKFGVDGLNTSLSLAVRTTDGRIFVETYNCASQARGFGWMIDFVSKAKPDVIVVDGKGKSNMLTEAFAQESIRSKIVIPTSEEAITAYATFRQAVDTAEVCHNGQPSVTQAISNCEKRMIGSNGAFGFRSIKQGVDISIVESLAFAYWACATTKERKKQRIGY